MTPTRELRMVRLRSGGYKLQTREPFCGCEWCDVPTVDEPKEPEPTIQLTRSQFWEAAVSAGLAGADLVNAMYRLEVRLGLNPGVTP